MVSFHFNKIELEHECDPDPQLCDSVLIFEFILTPSSLPNLNPIPESMLSLEPIILEHEPPILDSHIPLLGNECELEFYDLDQTHEPTLTLEPKLDLSFFRVSIGSYSFHC